MTRSIDDMPIACQAQNACKTKKVSSGWDRAIRDAKKRIKDLQLSIEVFKERKMAGEPWPGDSKN
jgi:hypothetical protein